MSVAQAQLPLEVLYMVAKVLAAECDELELRSRENEPSTPYAPNPLRQTLRNLRLTCRGFADMGVIKASLFEKVTFRATHDQINRLKQTNFASFAAFVRQVVFVPSPYAVDVDEEEFEAISILDLAHPASDCHDGGNSFALRWMPKIWRANAYFERSMMADFRTYRSFAVSDQVIISEGHLQTYWIAALEQFQNAHSFKISHATDCGPSAPSSPPITIDGASCDSCRHHRSYLDFKAASSVDLLFSAVIECLVSARVEIKQLAFNCDFKNTFTEGWHNKWWDQLSLESTADIQVFDLPYTEGGSLLMAQEEYLTNERLLAELWKKTHTGLETITLQRAADLPVLKWPSPSHIQFPQLQSVSMKAIHFETSSLRTMISASPKLAFLHLDNCWPLPNAFGQWKLLFDEVRRHPIPMQFEFSFEDMEVGPCDWKFSTSDDVPPPVDPEELMSYYWPTDLEDLMSCDWPTDGEEYNLQLQYCVHSYLCNKIEWIDVLEDFFPQS